MGWTLSKNEEQIGGSQSAAKAGEAAIVEKLIIFLLECKGKIGDRFDISAACYREYVQRNDNSNLVMVGEFVLADITGEETGGDTTGARLLELAQGALQRLQEQMTAEAV